MDVFLAALEAALDSKKQAAGQGAKPPAPPAEDPRAVARRLRAAAPAPAPAPAAATLSTAVAHPQQSDGGLLPLFEDGKSLIRAIVAAEVLGPPVALREPSPWSPPPNERSI